jgi:hypothetical protein
MFYSLALLPHSWVQIFSSALCSQTSSAYVPPLTWGAKFHSHTNLQEKLVFFFKYIHTVSQEERSIFWEVIVSVFLSKKCICTCVLFRTVSEMELRVFHCTVHCTLYRRATRHVLTRAAKCSDVDGEFSKMYYTYSVNCINFVTWTTNTGIRTST